MSFSTPQILCGYLLSMSFLISSPMLQAGAGHDHGHENEAAPVLSTAPRLAMESNQFELVIVRESHGLLLYLDDFANNTPLTTASIDLEINGQSVSTENTQKGTYHAHLETPLADGEHSVMATIIANNASDLLVDEWDIHHDNASNMESASIETTPLQKLLPLWLGIGSGMGIVLLSAFWRDTKHKEASNETI
ncbi:MAG: Unknown protein [uncultured Thiotrichaceae bacterium]|uniref:CopC domain-containing protein n=1 Tax=uncultured Thiotrichaceae bacterium TaxID=298394 RepID=A0A6S6TNP9_9GAMM|nr:MAG: Unknown protein [uncultured Thiotrichaceae bacterium]